MEDVGEFITNLEKEMIEVILQGELDAHLGYEPDRPRRDKM